VISTKRIGSAAAALAVAALIAGCGSGSPDQPARTAAERPAPPTAVESTPPAKTNEASDGQGRKSAAKPKTLGHAVEEAKKKNLAKLAKGGGIARRIVRELTSRGGSRTVRGKDRVQRAIRRILNQSKAKGGSSSEPPRVAEAVRELLNQAAAK
jgi:flagellar basal body-associated protein FliL